MRLLFTSDVSDGGGLLVPSRSMFESPFVRLSHWANFFVVFPCPPVWTAVFPPVGLTSGVCFGR